MYRTIADIMKLKGFEGAQLVAGEQGLSKVVVGATLMEVPDIFPYLEKNALLLTTLYPLSGDPEQLSKFIPQLYDLEVSGIGIKPARYVREIPDIMIEQANQLGFPILSLPPEINLSTMANHILSLSLNENIVRLQFRDEMHRTLTKLLLDGADIENLAKNLSCMIKKSVVLLDKNLDAICAISFSPTEKASIYTGTQAEEMLKKRGVHVHRHMIHPIKAGKSTFGYIFVPDKPENLDDQQELQLALEQSAMLFATLFFKDDAVKQNQRNFRDVFIRDLLQGKIKSNIEIENKMQVFSLSVQFPQYVICLCLFTDDEILRKKVYDDIINNKLIQKELAGFTKSPPKDLNVTYFNNALVILTDGDSKERLIEMYSHVLDQLMRQYRKETKIGIGISNSASGFDVLDVAYKQAVSTVKTGDVLNKKSFVNLYSDNRLFHLIEQMQDHSVLRQFMRDKLGALIDCDKAEGSDLMDTLQSLIQGDFSYKKAAENAFLHYNTIRYRINKMKQLGVHLEGGQNLSELVLAYHCYTWLKAKNEL